MVSGKNIKLVLIILSIASGFFMPANICKAILPPVNTIGTIVFFLLMGYLAPLALFFIIGKNPNISICSNKKDVFPLNPKYPTVTMETGSLMAIGYYAYPTIHCIFSQSCHCLNGLVFTGISFSMYLAVKTVSIFCKSKLLHE